MRLFRRGIRITLSSIAARPGLTLLAVALGVDQSMSPIIANTIVVEAAFEWGASPARQHARGADSFRGSPW